MPENPAVEPATASDEALIARVQQGDELAFETLYGRHKQGLLRFFYRMLNQDDEKAQDFLQELFLKVVEKPHYFTGRSSFTTWIFSIANNMVKNEYRRLHVRRIMVTEENLDLYSDPATPRESVDGSEFQTMVLEKLQDLDHNKRSTFLLRFQEEFSLKEISEILGCSTGTVKSRLFYTTRYLAAALKQFSPNQER